MSSFSLKIIAFACMLIDHIGLLFFPDLIFFRVVGRLSMPLFAFLISQGFLKSKNVGFYFLRLLIFALVTQPIYLFFIRNDLSIVSNQLNILFSFFWAILLLFCFVFSRWGWFLILSGFVSLLCALRFLEYGAYGILTVFFFYYFSRNGGRINFKFVSIFALLQLIGFFELNSLIQPVSFLSLFFVDLYNGKLGLKDRRVFYWLYPLHFLILLLLVEVL